MLLRRLSVRLPGFLLAVAAAPAVLAAQSRVVAGRVADDTGAVIAGARVMVQGGVGATGGVLTREDGRFVLAGVPAGTARLVVTRLGFLPRRLAVTVPASGSDTVRVAVVLERSAVALDEVTVTAAPATRDPLAVAQATSALAGRALERSAGTSLGATLAREPGIAVRYQGPGASAPIIRGLSGDRIVILQDGQRTGDLSSTAPDHGVTIDPTAAERVEVVRGPAALLYGNNALGGVVNVISGDIPLFVPERATGSIVATGETASPGAGTTLSATAPLAPWLAVRARAGLRSHGDVGLGGSGSARLANTDLRNRSATVGIAAIGTRANAGLAWRGYGFEYGLPAAGGPPDFVRLDGWRHELAFRSELPGAGPLTGARVEAGMQRYAHDEVNADGSVGTALGLRTWTGQALARTRALGPFRDGAIGASLLVRHNGVTGAQALTPTNDSRGFGVFAFQEIPLGAAREGGEGVRIPLGLRYDAYEQRSEASDRFGAGHTRRIAGFSGSVGITAPLAEGVSLGANVARAMRPPTAEELFSQAGHAGTGAFEIGDPSLAREVNTGLDAVLRVRRRRASAQLAVFGSRVDGWIGLYAAGRDTVVDNGSGGTKSLPLYIVSQRDARLRGLEGSLDAEVREHVVVALTGDLVHGSDASGEPLPFLPPARLGVATRWEDARWSLGGGLRHAFAQRRVPANESTTDAYTLLDLHAGVRFTAAGRMHAVTLRGENVADVLYRDAASRVRQWAPNPGRNVVVDVRVWF